MIRQCWRRRTPSNKDRPLHWTKFLFKLTSKRNYRRIWRRLVSTVRWVCWGIMWHGIHWFKSSRVRSTNVTQKVVVLVIPSNPTSHLLNKRTKSPQLNSQFLKSRDSIKNSKMIKRPNKVTKNRRIPQKKLKNSSKDKIMKLQFALDRYKAVVSLEWLVKAQRTNNRKTKDYNQLKKCWIWPKKLIWIPRSIKMNKPKKVMVLRFKMMREVTLNENN